MKSKKDREISTNLSQKETKPNLTKLKLFKGKVDLDLDINTLRSRGPVLKQH